MTSTVFSTQSAIRIGMPIRNDAENRGDRVVNQHRDLEIERFLSVRVDLRRVAAFYQPNDKRAENMTQKVKKQSEQCAGVARTHHVRTSEEVDGVCCGCGSICNLSLNDWLLASRSGRKRYALL